MLRNLGNWGMAAEDGPWLVARSTCQCSSRGPRSVAIAADHTLQRLPHKEPLEIVRGQICALREEGRPAPRGVWREDHLGVIEKPVPGGQDRPSSRRPPICSVTI